MTIGLTDQSDYSICHLMVRIFIHTVCKISEVNWLKIGDVIRVTKIDNQFFCVDLVQILQEV